MEMELIGQLAQTGLLGLLLALALLAIYVQRKEITDLWNRLLALGEASGKEIKDLALSTKLSLETLTISNDSRAAAANAVADTQKAIAEALKSVATEQAVVRARVEEQSKDTSALMERLDRIRADLDNHMRRFEENSRRIEERLNARGN